MIEIEFAKRFIQRVTQFTDYNINVMDKDGIIIASRDANRVGSYHDVAYQIVTEMKILWKSTMKMNMRE